MEEKRKAAAINQLRRMCTRKSNGTIDVPDAVAEQFHKRGVHREELLNTFMKQCNMDKVVQSLPNTCHSKSWLVHCFLFTLSRKPSIITIGEAAFVKVVTRKLKRTRNGKCQITAGFYTEKEMAEKLNFDEPRAQNYTYIYIYR